MSIRHIAMMTVLMAGAMATAMATPIVLPNSGGLLNTAITINSTPRYSVNGGGYFSGTINGVAAWFWCVDDDNYLTKNSYNGDVITLDNQWAANGKYVAKATSGTFTTTNFAVGIGASGGYTGLTAEQRYQVAANLVSQMTYWSNPSQTSASTKDIALQNAVWAVLDQTGGKGYTTVSGTSANTAGGYLAAAVQAVKSNPTYGFGSYSVVSGEVTSTGSLVSCPVQQTFLSGYIQPSAVPEPATYGMLGAGLVALALAKFRRKA